MKQGWEIKRLDEVCTFINGRAYSKTELLTNGKYLVLRVGNFFTNNHWYYSDLELPEDKYCDNGDLLYAWSASFGPRIWTGEKVIYHYHIWKIIPDCKLITKEFLYLLLDWDTDKIKSDQGTGTTMMHVSKGSMEARIVPLPPLPEQQRIVAILDEAFAAIAKAKANAEQNLKNAKELFDSYLQSVFENNGEGWEEKRFDEICILQRGFDLPTHSRNEGNYPLVSSNGITDRIDLWKVEAPGVVTGRSGTIGNVHFIEEDYWPLNTALYIKEFHGNYEKYIYYFLKQFDLGKYSSGAGVPTLNRNNVHSEMVWLPKSLIEQQAIVQKLDALSVQTKKLEAIYQQHLSDLNELKKSILQKAFNGELKTTTSLAA